MLDFFRDHLKHVTSNVRQLAKALKKRQISPKRERKLAIYHFLKSKYHATYLGIFTDTQLETIDKLLDKAG